MHTDSSPMEPAPATRRTAAAREGAIEMEIELTTYGVCFTGPDGRTRFLDDRYEYAAEIFGLELDVPRTFVITPKPNTEPIDA